MSSMSRGWTTAVRAACDPVLAAAGFSAADGGFADALLWEMGPQLFAERYPDSGIQKQYAGNWPPFGIECWLHIAPDRRRVRLIVEGLDNTDIEIELTGDGRQDGPAIADEFARIFRLA